MIVRSNSKQNQDGSELRQDPITEKWVVVATGRAKRPQDFAKKERAQPLPPAYVAKCPFCNFEKFPQAPDTLMLPKKGKNWRVRSFPNKFPAFVPQDQIRDHRVGLYRVTEGVGFHEVVVARVHNRFLYRMSLSDLGLYIQAWRDRYRDLMTKPPVSYIQIIENHGRKSGGSVEHPHAQIFAIPVIPSDEVLDLLLGAERYYTAHGRCGYCDIITFESKEKKRVVYDNSRFLVVTPFTSRVPYEQWVLPKKHGSGIEELSDNDIRELAKALQAALRALAKGLRDPAYNLYVYSAPCDERGFVCQKDTFSHFHWHIQILPRLNVWGGFELATGVEITTALPEESAKYLRSYVRGNKK